MGDFANIFSGAEVEVFYVTAVVELGRLMGVLAHRVRLHRESKVQLGGD